MKMVVHLYIGLAIQGHWACYSGAEEAVNFLLNLNVNINEQDKEKLTPLHLATNEGREKIVLKLLQKNADRNLANNKGELPIDLARKKNHKKIAEILGEEDFNPLWILIHYVLFKCRSIIYNQKIFIKNLLY